MKTKFSRQLFYSLAITAVFSITMPVSVSANDSGFITNVVISTNSTGGQSLDGQDGVDGQPGKDGKSGADGQSVNTVKIKSTVENIDITNVEDSETSPDEIETIVSTHASSSSTSTPSTDAKLSDQNVASLTESELSFISRTLLTIRLILIDYVNKLF